MKTAMMALLALTIMACGSSGSDTPQEAVLAQVQSGLGAELNSIDRDLARASENVGQTGIDSQAARPALDAVTENRPYAIDCVTIDTHGVIRIVEPAGQRQLEGTDVSNQAAVQEMLRTHEPVFSDVFTPAEGSNANVFAYPVFSAAGPFIGSLSLLVNPAALCDGVIAPAAAGTPFKSWVMQLDGLIVYESDPTQIGLNLFTDPLYQDYPELIALGRRIAAEPVGAGFYSFPVHGTDQVVRKEAVWSTVSLFDNEWRVVIYQEVS